MHCSSDDFSNNSLCLQQLKCSFGQCAVSAAGTAANACRGLDGKYGWASNNKT